MVKIRLARHGAKKRPYYHVVVADIECPRDGKFLEQIGTYDPSRPDEEIRLNVSRADYWMSVGAQPTGRAKKIINLVRRRDAAEAAAAPEAAPEVAPAAAPEAAPEVAATPEAAPAEAAEA